jgi:hypothetical protein
MDDTGQAAVHAAEVMKRNPEFTIRTHYLPTLHYEARRTSPMTSKHCARQGYRSRLVGLLHDTAAGHPHVVSRTAR